MNGESEAGRISMLARRVVAERSSTVAERLQDELGRQIADLLSYGKEDVLCQALVTMIGTYEKASRPEERRLSEGAIEELVTAIEHHATTREIQRPDPSGVGARRFTAHLFAIPVCFVRRSGRPMVAFQNLGKAASTKDYLRAVEASIERAIGSARTGRAMLRVLDHVYTPREIDAIGWVAARRLTLHVMCHASGTPVPGGDLCQAPGQREMTECVEVRYLIGVYAREGDDAAFQGDPEVQARMRSWARDHLGAIAGYMARQGAGRFDRVFVGLPSGLYSAVRHGQAGVSRHRFQLELERVVRQAPGELLAAVEVLQEGDEPMFHVEIKEVGGNLGGRDRSIGRVARKAHPFESPEEVLEDIAACLLKAGIRRIEVTQAVGDVLCLGREEEKGGNRLH
jgi:hypothetical protein